MALKPVKVYLDRVLDKNLQDLVRGIRNHKDDEAKYISECLDEIKQELRSGDVGAKSNAITKLLYLQMLGHEISWAAFNVIEVMSSTKFTHKRIGYLTASQSFHTGTDVLMLSTNLIRKDLCSTNLYDAGVALSGLSCFISPDLAQDLANDIMTLMTSTRPYLRKKAVLLMYKVYLNYPEALRPSFARLKDRLEDEDPGVQSAAVNVICELARKNPQNYLSLAPTFFKLMTSSTNNWMLIKIIKLFGALTPLEPRLGKKLIEPLTNLIHSTSAMSLLYECINTVIAVLVSISSDLPDHATSVQLCVQKLRVLIEDSDQNLKYLGLLAFSKILKSHPKSVQAHKDLVLSCLDDKDESIRLRALDLLHGMVSKKNLMEIVKKLMDHMEKAEGTFYRDEMMAKIIQICTQGNYQFVVNFEWYVSVLVELTKMKGTQHGRLLADQMMDVAVRVSSIRPFAVGQMAILIDNLHHFAHNSQKNGICEILYAAAWICGEYAKLLPNPLSTLKAMFSAKVTSLPGHIQSVFVQNIVKLFTSLLLKAEASEDQASVRQVCQTLLDSLPKFIQSADLEVQERACCALQLTKYVSKLLDKGVTVGEELSLLFSGDLNPVAPKAQKKVPVPEGLDLDQWINAPPKSVDVSKKKSIFSAGKDEAQGSFGESERERRKEKELTPEQAAAQREARLLLQASNPHYLKLDKSKPKVEMAEEAIDINDIPIEKLELSLDIEERKGLEGLARSDKYYIEAQKEKKKKKGKTTKGKKGKRRRNKDDESEEDVTPVHQVSTVYDAPEGANGDKSDHDDDSKDEIAKKLNINLEAPLRADESLPRRHHRTENVPPPVDNSMSENKPKEKKKKRAEKESSDKKTRSSKTSKGKSTSDEIKNSLFEELVVQPTPTPSVTPTPAVNKSEVSTTRVNGETVATLKVKKDKTRSKKVKTSKSKKEKLMYEEAEGYMTPTKEVTNLMDRPTLNLSNYQRLASDDNLSLDFESRVSLQTGNTLVVAVVFGNSSNQTIKALDFNVLDSMNMKLLRQGSNEAVKVPFELLPAMKNEAQFFFTVQSISMPQKLKGTVTYILKGESGSTQHMLDFRLVVPCKDFLVPVPCTTDDFTKLLSSGELGAKYSKRVKAEEDFHVLLTRICFYGHLYVVEHLDKSASLNSCSTQGHNVCLLVKQQGDGEISIDGKCNDSNYLSQVIDEVAERIKK